MKLVELGTYISVNGRSSPTDMRFLKEYVGGTLVH